MKGYSKSDTGELNFLLSCSDTCWTSFDLARPRTTTLDIAGARRTLSNLM